MEATYLQVTVKQHLKYTCVSKTATIKCPNAFVVVVIVIVVVVVSRILLLGI